MTKFYTYFLLLFLIFSGSLGLLAQPFVFFEMRNEVRTGSEYAFDIYMKSDQSGNYHSRGQLYINYDTAAFGENVVFNNKLSYDSLSLLSEVVPGRGDDKYKTTNLVDNNVNRFAITWESLHKTLPANSGLDPFFRTLMPDTFQPLYHFTILMKDTTEVPNLNFDWTLMDSQAFYFAPNSNNEDVYGGGNLPVKYSYFNAEKLSNQGVKLSWATSYEFNNSHFWIEKMQENGNFEVLGREDGAGNSIDAKHYTFKDIDNIKKENIYRLRQVDFDGAYSFSETLTVHFSEFSQDKFQLSPNPAQDFVTISALSKTEVNYPVQIMNMNGRLVFSNEISATEKSLRINLDAFQSGLYYVHIQGPAHTQHSMKLMVND